MVAITNLYTRISKPLISIFSDVCKANTCTFTSVGCYNGKRTHRKPAAQQTHRAAFSSRLLPSAYLCPKSLFTI